MSGKPTYAELEHQIRMLQREVGRQPSMTGENDRKYRVLFEQSQDAMLIIENQAFVDCNQATLSMLGYRSKEEFLQTHPSYLSPAFQPDGRDSYGKAKDMIAIALQKGSHRFEWDHVRADGSVFPVEVLLTTISSEKNIQVIHTIWRDITERKRAEVELRKEKEFASTLIDNAPAFFVVIDAKGRIRLMNPLLLKALGYTSDEVVGKKYLDVFIPETERESLKRFLRNQLLEQSEELNESRILTRDGRQLLVEWRGTPVYDDHGSFQYCYCLGINITERKAAELALEKERQTLASILQSTPHGIVLTDNHGNIVYVNPYFSFITGYTLTDIPTKKCWFEKVYPDLEIRNKAEKTWLDDFRTQGIGVSREFRIVCKDGSIRDIEFNSTFLREQSISVLTDITQRKHGEELRRERDRLQGVLELSGAVCHEMNQPLMTISGCLELMAMDIPQTSPFFPKVRKMQEQIDRMTGITKTLMDISRYETKDYLKGKIVDLSKSASV